MTISGLKYGISGVISVVKWLKLPILPASEVGDRIGIDSEDEEPSGEAIQWPMVSTSSSYIGDEEISTGGELQKLRQGTEVSGPGRFSWT